MSLLLATHSFPVKVGSVKKGDVIMMKEQPVRITSLSHTKCVPLAFLLPFPSFSHIPPLPIRRGGKHGHAKTTFTGKSLTSGRKVVSAFVSRHTVDCPEVQVATCLATFVSRPHHAPPPSTPSHCTPHDVPPGRCVHPQVDDENRLHLVEEDSSTVHALPVDDEDSDTAKMLADVEKFMEGELGDDGVFVRLTKVMGTCIINPDHQVKRL